MTPRARLWSRIGLVGLALMAPMVALVVHLAYQDSARQRQALNEQALATARIVAAQTVDTFALARAKLDALAPHIEAQLSAPDCGGVLSDLVTAQSLYFQLYVADEAGAVRCSVLPAGKKTNVADRDYFRTALDRRELYVSGLLQGRVSKQWTVVVAKPLPETSRAVLLGAMDLRWLQATLDNFELPPGSVLNIADRAGRTVARFPFVPEFIGRPVVAPAMNDREGTYEGPNFNNVPSVIAYAAVPGYDMVVRVAIPLSVVGRTYLATLYESLGVAAITVAVAMLLGALTFRRLIGAPLQGLTNAAARLRSGDLASRTGVAHDSPVVGELASKLDELATHSARVTRALRALSAGNRTLLHNRDEGQLLREMCKVAVERAGYAVAYACYAREDEAKSIDVVAQHGQDNGFIKAVPLTWADTEFGQGTIGRCIRSGERTIIRSIAADAKTGPWKEAATRSGFAAVISLPLRVNGALIGTFTLMAREDGFDDAEVDLLDEMAADLSFGIEVIRSESRRKEAEAIARRALTHDAIIDVPNRAWFVRRVVECIERGTRNHEPVAVLNVHVGRLQDILDSFGYEHGNAVLRQVAERLTKLPGCEDNLGRLPVDDFGIVLCGHSADAAERIARAALDTFATPVRIGAAVVDVQASVGVSFFPGHGDDAEILIRRASIAARDGFRRDDPVVIYSGGMARENPARLSLATELRAGIEARELALHFQPKVQLADGCTAGCEGLVRWAHPTRGMIPPVEFITLAEDIGLIRQLTYQVIDLAIRQLHGWHQSGLTSPIAVNLSARNLYDPGLFEAVEGMFRTWGVPRHLVHFEITEGALVDEPTVARRTLERLAETGAKIYIDDFGTGYSSLSYLVSLPVHALKIDRSFVLQMSKSPQARGVVASIISMAHTLNLQVVAEGVETTADASMLQQLGCDFAQGYLYSRPVPAADYEAWCRAQSSADRLA